ncbi:MAG: winged helix-turn-helix transcriptional regulator [Gammaproteobacteria bacterium]|nr:winged helix-turn-helix transcriptional regulator [Gammaproteobacteria bacterium]
MNSKDQASLNLATFFPYQFSVLAQQMSEYIAQIYRKQYGLSRFEWRVLATVAQHQEIGATEIMQFTRLDKMQVSRAIVKLKAAHYLVMQKNKLDRRANKVNLTPLGSALYQEIVPLVQQQEQRLLSGLNNDEQGLLKSLLVKVSKQLD